MTLRRFLREIAPGSFDPPYSWDDEADHLWANEPERMSRLVDDIARNGQARPVMVGDDGRLWDGHHRVTALRHLGRTYLTIIHWGDLTDDEQAEHLVQSIEDWEAKAS
jgi:ParB-like chromosome segregation protein Spo0J